MKKTVCIFLSLFVITILSSIIPTKVLAAIDCEIMRSRMIQAQNSNCLTLNYDKIADINGNRNVDTVDMDKFNLETNNGNNEAACTNLLNQGEAAPDYCSPSNAFYNLSSSSPIEGPSTFNFSYGYSPASYHVNMSTYPNMSWDVYLGWGYGSSSPISVSNPSNRWDKYSCGRTLYWRVYSSDNYRSPIQTTSVTCPTPTPTPAPKKVFVSKNTMNGNLVAYANTFRYPLPLFTSGQGKEAADSICNKEAYYASPTSLNPTWSETMWKSWISDQNGYAANRLVHHDGEYQLIDGTKVADNWADLTDGTLDHAINMDQDGNANLNFSVRTNTKSDGTKNLNNYSCTNWTVGNDAWVYAEGGSSSRSDAAWTQAYQTDWNGTFTCSSGSVLHLYCIEQ